LAVGASTTIDISGFVINHNPATYDISVSLLGDTNPSNNTAVLTSEPGFAFPAKVQINAAIYVTQETTINATPSAPYDKLIVGLFQGAPGIQGAVWCKIPNPITIVGPSDPVLENEVLFPTPLIGGAVPYSDYFGDRWRPCANGLPFPLHVNDIFEDDNNTPLDYTDDTLWLMTWGSAGLYRSDDKGESWTAAAPDATCASVPTDCLANGNGGNGAWTNVYAMTRGIDGFLYISVNDGYVFRSLNDGVSWQQVGSLPEVDADTPWSLVADPDDAGTIYAGTFGRGVYVSTDWGFTWDFLGGDVENDVLLGNPMNDPDSPDDLYAGHIFDLEIGSIDAGDDFLFAGTGNGIWRYNLDAVPTAGLVNSGWEFFGPTVTQGATDYVPEIRSLAMGPDADDTDGPDFLIGGSWGFGGFSLTDPAVAVASPTAALPIILRGANVTFVAVAPTTGQAFFGTDTGENITLDLMASTSTATEDEFSNEIPDGYVLGQNYPNPFNPVTTIQFALPESGNVRLAVYDILGREVAILVDKAMTAGQHDVQFSAQNLSSGTYIYRLTTDKGSFTKQLSLLK
jgi:Secretion system C-terminal sorting domain